MKDCRARLASEHPLASPPTPRQARPRRESGCPLGCCPLFLPALPTTATRGLPCAKNGKSLPQVRAPEAPAPGAVPSLRSQAFRPAGVRLAPPYLRGFTRLQMTFSSLDSSSGLESGTLGSLAPSSKLWKQQKAKSESREGTQAGHIVGAQ